MKEIGSEFSFSTDQNYYFKNLINRIENQVFLRCGRDALGYVADLLDQESKLILMPAYCCESMFEPFLVRGWTILYYSINEDLTVNVESLFALIKKNKVTAILLMNFFGIADTREVVNKLKSQHPTIQIIEDVTHTLFDLDNNYSDKVDYYVASIRKWLGITDGAIVISNGKPLSNLEYRKNDFVSLRTLALNLKEEYDHTKKIALKSTFRDLFLRAELSLDRGKDPHGISPCAENVLIGLNSSKLISRRKKNGIRLLSYFQRMPEITLPLGIERITDGTPFSIPILVNNRDYFQKLLAEKGVYSAVLWPLSQEARATSVEAQMMESSMLSIPIDQRYDSGDMDYICETVKEVSKKINCL